MTLARITLKVARLVRRLAPGLIPGEHEAVSNGCVGADGRWVGVGVCRSMGRPPVGCV